MFRKTLRQKTSSYIFPLHTWFVVLTGINEKTFPDRLKKTHILVNKLQVVKFIFMIFWSKCCTGHVKCAFVKPDKSFRQKSSFSSQSPETPKKIFLRPEKFVKLFLWTPRQQYRILRIIPVTPRYHSLHWYYPSISTLARHFVPHRLPSRQPLAYIIARLRLACFFSTR